MFPVVVIPESRFFASLFNFSNLSIRIVFTGGDKTAPVGAPKPAKAGSATDADNTLAAATETDAIFNRFCQEPSSRSVVVTSSSDDDDDDDSRVINRANFFFLSLPLLLPLLPLVEHHDEDAHRGETVVVVVVAPIIIFILSELCRPLTALCLSVGKKKSYTSEAA